MRNLLANIPLWSAVIALVTAQAVKPILYYAVERKWDWRRSYTTGGMPSSHTATTIALTVSTAIIEGLGSTAFAICAVLSLVIMNDATNVRLETGKQAKIINEWSEYLSEIFHNGPFSEQNLKTMIGHSSLQVFAGFIWGLIIGFAVTMALK